MASREKRTRFAVAFLVLLVAVGTGWFLIGRSVPGVADLRRHLRDRGRVVFLGREDFARLSAPGATLVDGQSIPGLVSIFDGEDESAVVHALENAHIESFVIDASARAGNSVHARLSRLMRVSGFSARYIAPSAVLYVVRAPFAFSDPRYGDALAVVARRVLVGEAAPQIDSFPEALREEHPVEVMIRIMDEGRARMWRSSKGSSIASALLVATQAVGVRWRQRESAMGEGLVAGLQRMSVEVLLLEEDGSIGDPSPALLDRAIQSGYGIGYALPEQWEYLTPEQTSAEGSGTKALRALLQQHSLPDAALSRDDMRIYRFSLTLLGRSLADGSVAD